MKKIYLFAAMAAMMAACSSDDLTAEMQTAQQQSNEKVAVDFDAYVPRTTTRAGLTGELKNDDDGLQKANVGFGVFGYYTNADNYDQTFMPNFMYNQHVTYSSSTWSYSPVKYWPNEFGSYAQSDDVDKVSFFAYAPYVTVNPASGKVMVPSTATYDADNGNITMGIVGMKRNNDTGDPMVKYISTFYTDKQVDLIWGTVASASNSWGKKNGGGTQALPVGLPFLDVQHPYKTSTSWNDAQKVSFDFKHSLAALNVQVDTKVNSTSPAAPATGTKVYIRSVTFEGFDTKGALNLNNAQAGKALWYNFNCEDELNNGNEVTVKDGRKDGKEGLTAATKEYAAINPLFVQSAVFESATVGVTNTAGNLFCKAAGTEADKADPIYVIPNGDKLKVTIEYDVLTADKNLAGTLNDGQTKGSVVKNVITRYITADEKGSTSAGDITLTNGKKYLIKLHLGLNSVEFDASVTGWNPAEDPDGGADLPHNN